MNTPDEKIIKNLDKLAQTESLVKFKNTMRLVGCQIKSLLEKRVGATNTAWVWK